MEDMSMIRSSPILFLFAVGGPQAAIDIFTQSKGKEFSMLESFNRTMEKLYCGRPRLCPHVEAHVIVRLK
jgi:hypothetical protein